jgi:hypothetical protein
VGHDFLCLLRTSELLRVDFGDSLGLRRSARIELKGAITNAEVCCRVGCPKLSQALFKTPLAYVAPRANHIGPNLDIKQ